MKVELRNTGGEPALLLLSESLHESLLIDALVGDKVDPNGLIGEVEGKVVLADGFGEHYIRLTMKG